MVRATSEPFDIIDCENACPRVFDRFQRFRGDAVDIDRELIGLCQGSRPGFRACRRSSAPERIGLLLHIADDLVGSAGHGRAEAGAGGENRAFDFSGGRLDLGNLTSFDAATSAGLRIEGAGRNIVGGGGGDRAERPLDVGGDRPDLACGVGDVVVSEPCASRALLRWTRRCRPRPRSVCARHRSPAP